MPFTGRIGTDNSRFGNIVLGIVDAFDLPTIGFRVHVLSPREVRVLFDRPVTDSALNPSHYVMSAVTAGAIVPSVSTVDFYDADRLSVVVHTALSMTWQSLYSMQVVDVFGFDGEAVRSDAGNFTANCPDGARAVGAFLSKRGMVDIVFDRPVGPTAIAATAVIRSTSGGGSVQMILRPWSGEAMPDDTLRFVYPVTTPLAPGYAIDYASVVDAANNVGSGSVPLSLRLRSPAPYNSSSLSQMQILDAHVVDVVPYVNAATVRTYFSGPGFSNDVLNPARWNITQQGPHPRPDTVHPILVPDCANLVDCFNFLNACKSTFAAHILEDSIHKSVQTSVASAVSSGPVAVDYVTANSLYLVLRTAFAAHGVGPAGEAVHLYPEPSGFPAPPTTTDIPGFIAATNSLKALYNQHLAAERSLPFYGDYPLEIGPLTDRASSGFAYPVRTDLTYFVDAHVVTAVQGLPVRVRCNVRSEDLGSTTDPAQFSGDFMARASFAPAQTVSGELVLEREVRIRFDKEISVPDPLTVAVRNDLHGNLPDVHFAIAGTIPDAMWFYNSLVFAYGQHLSPSPVGAGHLGVESQYFVVPGDYCTTSDLVSLMFKANVLRMKYNGHVRNAGVHTNLDELVTIPDATDLPSLMRLLDSMRTAFNAHNESGDFPVLASNPPRRSGRHNSPGVRFLVAPLFTGIVFQTRSMLDGAVHHAVADVVDVKWDLRRQTFAYGRSLLDASFIGYATHPSVASAMPRPGLVLHEDREGKLFYSFEPDTVEVFFSKPMRRTELNGGTGSSVQVAGGDLVLKRADWMDDRVASLHVLRMEQISYTLDTTGLVDLAGNPTV